MRPRSTSPKLSAPLRPRRIVPARLRCRGIGRLHADARTAELRRARHRQDYTRVKATVRIEHAGKLHVDTLDLYSVRARRQLALDLPRILEESADTIDADLIKLLGACETHAERPAASASDGAVIVMTDADRHEGEALGRDPKLVEIILGDYERCGLVGEPANKLLCYLAMTSRKLPK